MWLWAWHDRDQSWAAAEKTLPFQDRIRGAFAEGYWAWFSLLAVLRGDYGLAEESAARGAVKWLQPWVLSLIHSAKRECARAQSFADTAFKAVSAPWRIPLYYHLAECQLAAGQFDEAATVLHQLQVVYENLWGLRHMYYPKSFYLLGKIYEQKGDRKLALEHYEKFLDLWQDADEDLPDLLDARARYENLEAIL